jgi:hypothetical protein
VETWAVPAGRGWHRSGGVTKMLLNAGLWLAGCSNTGRRISGEKMLGYMLFGKLYEMLQFITNLGNIT